jgi:tRNA (cytidine/uridine-2'-O-)-methyltransferase
LAAWTADYTDWLRMTSHDDLLQLRPHRLKVALLHPQIAPNTGNIARTCVATGTELHLVRPLGFVLSDQKLRRSAMDYWERLKLTLHDDASAFFAAAKNIGGNIWLLSSGGQKSIWETPFADGDWLIFGSETRGISDDIKAAHPGCLVRIPQMKEERCLNLATAAGVTMFEALRRIRCG